MKTKFCGILAASIIGISLVPQVATATAVDTGIKTAITYDEETGHISSGDTLSDVEVELNYNLGDINMDFSIDASDASMILKYYADVATGKNVKLSCKELGDVNRDAIVDSTDASAILSYYASTSTGTPATWPKPKFDLRATYSVDQNTPVYDTLTKREAILPSKTKYKIEGSNNNELHIYTVDGETTEVFRFSLLYADNIIRIA